jgi:Uncharacterized protein conserved in bacteria (DUF2252)
MNAKVEHPSTDDRRARGKEAGNRTPPSSHAGWEPAVGRPDPVALLEEQNTTREPDLVPVRHGRMMVSPFTFYLVEAMSPSALGFYAGICGWTLARAHARSGDPVAISEYLGDSDTFDRAVADFSKRYADQNELDYQEFVNAIRSGRLQALQGV